MGRRYTEPTVYRDRQCPYCKCYFTARGLNGHIRFYHEGFEKSEIKRLKSLLWNKALYLYRHGHKEVEPFFSEVGDFSDATLEDLRELEDTLNIIGNRLV